MDFISAAAKQADPAVRPARPPAQVVKLSDAVQALPRSVTEFVHGVPESFLAVGQAKAAPPPEGGRRFGKGAYFIGKVRLQAQGFVAMVDCTSLNLWAVLGGPKYRPAGWS